MGWVHLPGWRRQAPAARSRAPAQPDAPCTARRRARACSTWCCPATGASGRRSSATWCAATAPAAAPSSVRPSPQCDGRSSCCLNKSAALPAGRCARHWQMRGLRARCASVAVYQAGARVVQARGCICSCCHSKRLQSWKCVADRQAHAVPCRHRYWQGMRRIGCAAEQPPARARGAHAHAACGAGQPGARRLRALTSCARGARSLRHQARLQRAGNGAGPGAARAGAARRHPAAAARGAPPRALTMRCMCMGCCSCVNAKAWEQLSSYGISGVCVSHHTSPLTHMALAAGRLCATVERSRAS